MPDLEYGCRNGRGRVVGVVTRWEPAGGFGLLRAGARTYFVHVSAIDDSRPLEPGEFVAFTPEANPRGLRAVRVHRFPARCPKCSADLRALECPACGFNLGASFGT